MNPKPKKQKYPPTSDPLRLLRLRPHNVLASFGYYYAAGGREARATARDLFRKHPCPIDIITATGRLLVTLHPPATPAESPPPPRGGVGGT